MKEIKTVAVIGYGVVGKAIYSFLRNHYDVIIYDKFNLEYSRNKNYNNCDLAIVCVPTPSAPDGSCDTSQVEEVISGLKTSFILIKSTVPPGTTDRLSSSYDKNIVFSPEFCGESSYWSPYKFHNDLMEMPYFIFGGKKELTKYFVNLYMKVSGPIKIYKQTSALNAEMVKYMENCFYATKVVFCHEIARICETINIDYNDIRELFVLDPRVNPMHTAVFSNKNGLPAGGRCFPKDLSALIEASKKFGYAPEFLEEVRKSNLRLAK